MFHILFVRSLLFTIGTVLCLSLIGSAVSASDLGLSLSPFESVKVDIAPGEKITRQIKLQLGEHDQAMDIAVDITGFGMSSDGTVQAIDSAQDSSPYSASKFISVNNNSFHLEPGESVSFVVTISVPSDVGGGGRYAVVYVHQQQPSGSGPTGSISAFNIPILLTIKDSRLVYSGEVTEIIAGEAISGKPIDIFTTFQNTGNIHFKVKGEVTISNAQGAALATIPEALTPSSILPAVSRQLKATFSPGEGLTPGIYFLKSKVILEDGTLLDETEGSFHIDESLATAPITTLAVRQPKGDFNWLIVILSGVLALALAGILFVITKRKRN